MHTLVNSFTSINIPDIHAGAVDVETLKKMFLSEPLQGKVRELQVALACKLFSCVNPLYQVYFAHTF